jgi:hypothetical protein
VAETKQRHGCLAAWLVLMIIANSLTALVYLIAGGKIKSILPNAPTWALATLVVTSVCNVVFAVALFQWKKWGFFGFVGTTGIVFVVNLLVFHVHAGFALLGLLGVAILFVTLQVGEEKKGWTQLED